MSAVASNRVAVPDIGDFEGVPVIEILVSVGDAVDAEAPLVTLESDKATMDVPAPYAGTVREILVSIDERVSEGAELMVIEPADAAAQDEGTAPAAVSDDTEAQRRDGSGASAPRVSSEAAAGSAANGGGAIYASPSARRLARELAIDIAGLHGSGRGGRITRDDVQHAADSPPTPASAQAGAPDGAGPVGGLQLLPWPTVDFEQFGPVERVERTRIQRIAAPNLARNWAMIPHVTQHDEADITELEQWRKRLNAEHASDDVKFTMVSFLVKASVAALQRFETFNSSLDGDQLVLKRYYNIGFAADTPNGLVVPVIKDADRKGLTAIARDLTELSGKAREGKLSPAQMSGATFTISSLGGIGGTSFTPIINAPEVAILGVSRAQIKPVWNASAESFEPRLMIPLSLSYDHRVIDGAAAARFVVHLAKVLSDLRQALL